MDVGSDFESLANTDDPIRKYCDPIQRLMNDVVLKERIPKVQLLRGTVPSCNNCGIPTTLFASGFQQTEPFSASAHRQTRRWHTPSHPDHKRGPIDWARLNKCLAAVAFVPPGALNTHEFHLDDRNELPQVHGPARHAFAKLLVLARNVRAEYAILTDEMTSVVVRFDPCADISHKPLLSIKHIDNVQLRVVISACIYAAAASRALVRIPACGNPHFVQGVLNDPTAIFKKTACDYEEKRWLSDFDLYTMQHWPELWRLCALWHEKVQQEALDHSIEPGAICSIEPGGFARRFALLRSPYPTQSIPQDTVDTLNDIIRRPRNPTLDQLLVSTQSDLISLSFVEGIRAGPKQFSQVYAARVGGCDEIFCVKLFDERFFPIPWIDDPECIIGNPHTRLLSLNFSEDLARREEAVYDRLSELQGSLLPHCYGFHMFTLPDGWQCLGLIMEKICGPTLSSTFLTYNENIQISVITKMRHAVRVLRAHGISQTDWHLSQVLCVTRDEVNVDILLIDFAFSLMYLGDEGGIEPRSDVDDVETLLSCDLGVDTDIIKKYWLPPLEFEY